MYELMGAARDPRDGRASSTRFVYRRRGYLIMFAVSQALMLYTHVVGHLLLARARSSR